MNSTALSRPAQPLARGPAAAAATAPRPFAGAPSPASADNFSRLLERAHIHNADAATATAAPALPQPQPRRSASTGTHDATAGRSGQQGADADGGTGDAARDSAPDPTAGEPVRKRPVAAVLPTRPARPLTGRQPDATGTAKAGSRIDADSPDGKTADASIDGTDAAERKPGDAATDPAALLANLAAAVRATANGTAARAADGSTRAAPAAPGADGADGVHGGASKSGARVARLANQAGNTDGTDSIAVRTTRAGPGSSGPVQATPSPGDMPVDFPAESALVAGSIGPAGPRAPAEVAFTTALPLPAAIAGAPGSAAAAATDATPAAGFLAATPGSDQFAPQLGAQISTFVRNGVHHARLELNPADMGPLTVQIRMDGLSAQLAGQAALPIEVHLSAEHAPTRHALEQSMPALASSLREAGLTLSGGGVFEQPRQPQPGSGSSMGHGNSHGGVAITDDSTPLGVATGTNTAWPGGRRRGVVDLVA